MQMKRDSTYFPNYWDTQSEFVTNDKIIEKKTVRNAIFVTNGLSISLHQSIKFIRILS